MTLGEKRTLMDAAVRDARILDEWRAGWSTVTPIPKPELPPDLLADRIGRLRLALALIYDIVLADDEWYRWACGSYNGTRRAA